MEIHLPTIALLGIFVFAPVGSRFAGREGVAHNLLLFKGAEQIQALESVLEEPEEYPALVLYYAAAVAFKEERLEDSGFLHYAADFRATFDRECFPPKGDGGDSPFVLFGGLSVEGGQVIKPALAAEAKVYANVVDRLKAWEPKVSKNYHPGYEFTERKPEEAARAATKPRRTEFLNKMEGLRKLFNDAEYHAAFRITQAYNLSTDTEEPTKEAHDRAMATMKRIEEEKGIEGIATLSGDEADTSQGTPDH